MIGAAVVLSILLCPTVIYPITRPAETSAPTMLTGVPDVVQGTDYSCGAASLQAVLSYWGVDMSEETLMEMLHTSPDNGTNPYEMVRVARSLGLDATLERGLTIDALTASIRDGVPVIVVAQAWTEDHSTSFSWKEDWGDGHYMVVVGTDQNHVYLEDPAIQGRIGMIAHDEFNDRWHDCLGSAPDAPGAVVLEHMGIFIKRDPSGRTSGSARAHR